MIPAPVPVFPIAAVLVAVAGVFFYAAFLAGRGAGRADRGSKAWRRGISVALAAAVLGIGSCGLLANILSVHDRLYDQAAWEALDTGFGVRPAAQGQPFTAGVPFAATVGGRSATCTVVLPSAVTCDGAAMAGR